MYVICMILPQTLTVWTRRRANGVTQNKCTGAKYNKPKYKFSDFFVLMDLWKQSSLTLQQHCVSLRC